jgi:glycosyltransferase involved in cell wall biosynthesis/2-polyprenyl-3-methyl-5-hydroxy-6-metoxy-1,4-benzoquinol methylase
MTTRKCWCGNDVLDPYSADYGRCRACGTLVSLHGLTTDQLRVTDDESDFYGKRYWLDHQAREFGYPDIHTRARTDLTERSLHWLRSLLRYRKPPAKVLEIGCAPGTFVALLQLAGYDASGVDLSPWVAEFARKTFGVAIEVGPVEALDIAPGSIDVIAMMDVLEHLPDPLGTMAHCTKLLKPDGLFLIQTPRFEEGVAHAELVARNDPFLEQIRKSDEHLYLFSRGSVAALLQRVGSSHIRFETAIFDQYDMFLASSAAPLGSPDDTQPEAEVADETLRGAPERRAVLALLDLREREMELLARVRVADSDCIARAEQIATLHELLAESEADRAARAEQITALQKSLASLTAIRAEQAVLRTVAVDLTPLLPGGANGGAKIFVLELLRHLSAIAPQTRFILLTQAGSHEELASLERPNVARRMVVGPAVATAARPPLERVARRVIPLLPGRVRGPILRVAFSAHRALKRGGSGALLREMGADLLFCPFTAPTYFEPGIPTVCTIYDLQYKSYPEFFAPYEVSQRENTFREATRRATLLAAISDYSREAAIRHGGLDRGRIRTIHLRIQAPDNGAAMHDETVLRRLGLASRRYLLYPANFWKHKNHEMLLTAFGIARRAGGLAEDITLVCTGAPDPRQAWLRHAAREMQLGDRVLLPGFLARDELNALVAHCAGVVFPSLYEGFGLPVIEAMAAGVPVACSNLTSLPEVAADAAILFDPRVPTDIAAAMVALVQDEVARRRLILAGRARAREFADPERMAGEYFELFLDALGAPVSITQMTGVYEDGWGAASLSLHLAPADADRTLELELAAPSWLPAPKVHVEAIRTDGARHDVLEVTRGTECKLSIPLGRASERLSLRVTPTFVPVELGLGEDSRELSLIVRRATILAADGTLHDLCPDVAAAPLEATAP